MADGSIAPMDEIQRRCDSAATAAKSSGSLIHINSIAIDLSNAVEKIESSEHEHFSIRGFVAGMRKKDQKFCSLFTSECNSSDLEASMPQLHPPKFRWWHCSKCIPEISTERTEIETMLPDRSDAGTSSCKHVDGRDGFFSNNREKYGRKDKTYVRIKEVGNSCATITQAHPLQVKERDSNSAAGQVEEPENSSVGCDGALITLPHKRKQKLRSLADIMEEERNSRNQHFRLKSTSCGGMQSTSRRIESLLAPRLQLDAPADVAKGTRSLQGKRKFSLEDTYASKRIKGLMVDAERTCRRSVQGSDSESNMDASKGLESQTGAKTRLTKPQKNKALEINKRIRPANIGNATVKIQEVPKVNSLNVSNSSIHAADDDTRFCKLGHFPCTPREIGKSTRSLPPGKLAEKNSDQSKNKQLEGKDDHNPLKSAEKSIFIEYNIKGKDGSGLSLNRSMDAERNFNNQSCFRLDIPDLNETFSQKTATERGTRSPADFEKSNLPKHKTLDISASCIKECSNEGKTQLGFSQLPTVQSTGKNIEFGEASDDIPMEIVELLVRTKREKELENLKKQFLPKEFSRGSPSMYAEGWRDDFPLANAKAGVTVATGNMCFSQSIPANFLRLNGCQLGTRRQEEAGFKLFDRFSPSQQWRPQYSVFSSVTSSPRPCDGADLFWPPRRENMPFHCNTMQNNYPIDSNIMGVNSFSELCHKGKTISDIKASERKKTVHNASVPQETRTGSSSKSVGSVDPYSNDAIPAMQLLSLMDRGIVSNSSIKVGSKNYLDKPFSPCNHHPRLSEKENQSFFRASFFSLNNHSNGFPLLSHGVYCPGESSKKDSSFIQGQILPYQENSASMYPEVPSNMVNQPSRSNSTPVLCLLNKNPADFSIPDARNEYTISAKDLKPRKWNVSKERGRPPKRRRVKKNAQGKECSRKLQETHGIA